MGLWTRPRWRAFLAPRDPVARASPLDFGQPSPLGEHAFTGEKTHENKAGECL